MLALIIILPNLCFAFNNIGEVLAKVIEILLEFSAVVALIGLVVGGYKYITSAGNPEAMMTGKQAITYSVVGIIIIILAVTATKFLLQGLGVTQLSFFGISF